MEVMHLDEMIDRMREGERFNLATSPLAISGRAIRHGEGWLVTRDDLEAIVRHPDADCREVTP